MDPTERAQRKDLKPFAVWMMNVTKGLSGKNDDEDCIMLSAQIHKKKEKKRQPEFEMSVKCFGMQNMPSLLVASLD